MDYTLFLCSMIITLSSVGLCEENNSTESDYLYKNVPKARTLSYADFIPCGLAMDALCFLDTADKMMETKRLELLAEADREAIRVTGRADNDNAPSHLTDTLSKLISEFTDLFKDGFWSFFKSAREGEDDEAEESEDSTKVEEAGKKDVSTSRKKKKKGKLAALIKLIVIGVVIKAVLTLLLKALSAALQVKFFLVALAGLLLNAARFYLDLKKGHQPQKVIYYEHAQHQHHYEGGEEDYGHSGPDSSYWGRSYDEKDAEGTAQNLAYSKQKPAGKYYSNADSSSNNDSWF